MCSIYCSKLENLLSIPRWVQTQTEGNRVLKQDHLNVVRGCQQLQEALSGLWLWHSIQIWEGLQIMTHNSSSDRHHAGMGQEWRDANGKFHYSANTSSNTVKNSFSVALVQIHISRLWLMSAFWISFAGSGRVRRALLTAAPQYKGEGMIGLQHMGQQLGKYPLISQSGVKTSLQAAPPSHSTLWLMKYLTTSVDKK